MTTLLHISDLHFGPKYIDRVGELLLQSAQVLAPDIVVVSGDLTQRARKRQFAGAKAFLGRLPNVPRLCVPGNHDVPLYRVFERWLFPYRNYRSSVGSDVDATLSHAGAFIVGLNSTKPLRTIVTGRISKQQLEFAAREFAQAPPGALRIAVVHHPLVQPPDRFPHDVVPGAEAILARFRTLGVELVLSGHLHRGFVVPAPLPNEERRESGSSPWIIHSGTSTSSRGRGPEKRHNSFQLIEFDEMEITVTHYRADEQRIRFMPIDVRRVPRARRNEP